MLQTRCFGLDQCFLAGGIIALTALHTLPPRTPMLVCACRLAQNLLFGNKASSSPKLLSKVVSQVGPSDIARKSIGVTAAAVDSDTPFKQAHPATMQGAQSFTSSPTPPAVPGKESSRTLSYADLPINRTMTIMSIYPKFTSSLDCVSLTVPKATACRDLIALALEALGIARALASEYKLCISHMDSGRRREATARLARVVCGRCAQAAFMPSRTHLGTLYQGKPNSTQPRWRTP